MARYFFDIHDGAPTSDEEGVELDSIETAQMEVWNILPMMAAHRNASGNMACQLRMDVRDESGKHLFHAAGLRDRPCQKPLSFGPTLNDGRVLVPNTDFSVMAASRVKWKGYLRLSLVSSPGAVYPASSERKLLDGAKTVKAGP